MKARLQECSLLVLCCLCLVLCWATSFLPSPLPHRPRLPVCRPPGLGRPTAHRGEAGRRSLGVALLPLFRQCFQQELCPAVTLTFVREACCVSGFPSHGLTHAWLPTGCLARDGCRCLLLLFSGFCPASRVTSAPINSLPHGNFLSTPSVVVLQCASCIPAGPAGTRWPPGALHFLHPHCVPLVLFRLPEIHSRTTEAPVTFLLPGNLVLTVLSLGGSRAAAFQRRTLSILLQMIWQHFVSHHQNIPRQSLVANYV